MFGARPGWIVGMLAFAALLVGGGMWLSSAHADPVAAPPPAATPLRDAIVVRPALAASPTPAPSPTAAAPDDGYVIKRVLDIAGPMRPGDYHWDEAGVPAGPVVITADLKAQTLSVFRGGYEIGTAVILYGADDKPTPLGVFPITQKKAQHRSTLYDADMPYMQRLTNDGVAIHGANVQPERGTHGCIGVPTAFAKLLFGVTRLGDKVIVTNGEMLNVGGTVTAAR